MSESLLLPAREAFQKLGIGRDAGYALVREGRLRAVRISGRRILIPRSELEEFVERELNQVEP